MENTGSSQPTKRPFSLVQESVTLQEPPTKVRRRLLQKPEDTNRAGQPRRAAPQLPPATPPTRVSRRCQTTSPVYMRLPRPCNTTLPVPWGVRKRLPNAPGTTRQDSKENMEDKVKQEIAELLGSSKRTGTCSTSAFGFRSAPVDDDDADQGQCQELWNPAPPPEWYESVEVSQEEGNTRSVATNTAHIRVDYPVTAKKVPRIKQWRKAARSWRV